MKWENWDLGFHRGASLEKVKWEKDHQGRLGQFRGREVDSGDIPGLVNRSDLGKIFLINCSALVD
jgi:hypothetical protein